MMKQDAKRPGPRSPFKLRHALVASSTMALLLAACGPDPVEHEPVGTPPAGLDWENSPSFLLPVGEVEPYTGTDPTVLEAQERLPSASKLHSDVVLRSCGPLGGVCHNKKEYPDLRTPANFLATVGAPCNVQSGTPDGVYDRCERIGDRFVLGPDGKPKEIGWHEVVPGDVPSEPSADMPGLHLHFLEPVSEKEDGRFTTARFFRSFVYEGEVEDLSFATFTTRWHVFDGGKHVVAEVPGYKSDELTNLLQVGIEQGDLNRNGVYGARPDENGVSHGPVSMIEPGDPETSYLVARLRGHMEGEEVPGTRMPLANPPFSTAEMLALFCFIEGLPDSGEVNLRSPIDYKNCSWSDPAKQGGLAVEGSGSGWSDRIAPLLEANCASCHSGEVPDAGLVLGGADVSASEVYAGLVGVTAPGDLDGRAFVTAGDPTASYLYLKLTADPTISGKAMPLDPLLGERMLDATALADIESWITDGAAP